MGGKAINPTASQNVRVPKTRWSLFGQQVGDRNRSETINQFIAWMNHEPGAKMPKRPPAPAEKESAA
jgi:hypothetical protein